MKPYYENDEHGITLFHADCLAVLPTLAGVDCVVTDPPFGRAFSSGRDGQHKGQQIAGDEDTSVRDAMLSMWGNRPSLVFGSWRHPVVGAKQAIVWDKGPASGMGDLKIPWKESWELIFVSGRGFNGFRDEGIIRGHTIVTWASKGRLHPNQKPVGLLAKLVAKCRGTILDPFAGSASTAIACIRTGRDFLGIEIEEKYCEIAAKRIERELAQPLLPGIERAEPIPQRELEFEAVPA